MNLDYTAAKFWLDVAHWIVLVALGVWTYLRTKDKDNTNAIEKVAQELAEFIRASSLANQEQNNRLTIMEETVKHLPTQRELTGLREEVASLTANIEGITAAMKRLEHQTNLIHEHLLSAK